MLKVGGIYVSPFEVEGALCTHPDVLEAAVVAWPDEDRLIKPKAFVVLKAADKAGDEPRPRPAGARQGRSWRPTSIRAGSSSAAELPKTATGKIQRFKLRAESARPDPLHDGDTRCLPICAAGTTGFAQSDHALVRRGNAKGYFGRTGLEISELAFGGGVTGGILINADEATRYTALRRAVAAGINWIDTAPIYGNGASEETIGRHLEHAVAASQHLHQGEAGSRRHAAIFRARSSAAWRRA